MWHYHSKVAFIRALSHGPEFRAKTRFYCTLPFYSVHNEHGHFREPTFVRESSDELRWSFTSVKTLFSKAIYAHEKKRVVDVMFTVFLWHDTAHIHFERWKRYENLIRGLSLYIYIYIKRNRQRWFGMFCAFLLLDKLIARLASVTQWFSLFKKNTFHLTSSSLTVPLQVACRAVEKKKKN